MRRNCLVFPVPSGLPAFTPRLDFLLILRVAPRLRGQEPPLRSLKYSPSYAESLPTIFWPNLVEGNEEFFPGGTLPWVCMPWPRYLYITPCVRRTIEKMNARCNERARARRQLSDGTAKEKTVDVGSEKQERSSADSGSEQERSQNGGNGCVGTCPNGSSEGSAENSQVSQDAQDSETSGEEVPVREAGERVDT
ncbi:hypothetical protein C8T65DRAFT_833859 [Cerioporus squamosus]|nr:hypothetical protein C8T65DRAFT_833859 [Cerioporus squamosus]